MTEAQRRWARTPVHCGPCGVDVPQVHLKRHRSSQTHLRLDRAVRVGFDELAEFMARFDIRRLRGWERTAYLMARGRAAA